MFHTFLYFTINPPWNHQQNGFNYYVYKAETPVRQRQDEGQWAVRQVSLEGEADSRRNGEGEAEASAGVVAEAAGDEVQAGDRERVQAQGSGEGLREEPDDLPEPLLLPAQSARIGGREEGAGDGRLQVTFVLMYRINKSLYKTKNILSAIL